MGYYLTVKRLKDILSKYDDSAIVMIAEDREGEGAVDASDEVSYLYRLEDGEIVDEFDSTLDESLLGKQRAVILWGVDR